MRLLVLSGFFGSGKTTLILRLAEALVAKWGMRVAVIVNDVGEVGIDDKVMKSYGLVVEELFGGCVCCELGSDLASTLMSLGETYKPDIAILEPSGAADPAPIIPTLRSIEQLKVDILPVTVVVDATQRDLVEEDFPVVTKKLKAADLILVNKIDIVDGEELGRVVEQVRKLNGSGEILPISGLKGVNVERVLTFLLGDRVG